MSKCPSTQPPIHSPIGGVTPLIKNQWELNYLDKVAIYLIFSDLTWLKPLTHPSNPSPTHGWRSLHKIQIFNQNCDVLLSWFHDGFVMVCDVFLSKILQKRSCDSLFNQSEFQIYYPMSILTCYLPFFHLKNIPLKSSAKNAIWDGTPPPAHLPLSLLVQECSEMTNL